MGMKIDACHVIHAWQERREGYHEYKTKVQVIDPSVDLDPVNWPSRVDMNAAYAKL